ncbi:DnaB-like helicase C-terminal domain-containing protein [Halobacillus ihumii]|uniref:DnaB-like helicase C-terminal domain-containing protein n=1 Tax=Halobacillus ihumii TaxID=2686092 RepID=UPI0013D7E7D1|nr:DnaB-like helicase C-terminal domain-containing protein [Halobacillus ihumii]
MVEEQIISKMLDNNDVHSVLKYNVNKDDFKRLDDVFEYIVDYRKQYGACPNVETVVSEFDDFEYQEAVHEPFKGLSARLKKQSAKRQAFEMLQMEAKTKYKELDGDEFVLWLGERTKQIERQTSTEFSAGTNFAINGQERKERYEEAKETRTHRYIPLPYNTLNEKMTGMELGDYVLLMAYTNRGKSWIATDMGRKAWRSGFGVLHYSPELSKSQQESRIETIDGKFVNSDLRRGQLENEEEYYAYLEQFELSEEEQTPYIVKTMEDLPHGLTLEAIEADLEMNPNISLAIIDGFNLMTHKGGGSNRDAMSNTSRKIRQLFARYGVTVLLVHQTPTSAEKENKEDDEEGARLVKPPTVDQYSETIAVVQDAATVLTFDQHDGIGKLLVAKCREPAVGEVVDLHCDFNRGYIGEPDLTARF